MINIRLLTAFLLLIVPALSWAQTFRGKRLAKASETSEYAIHNVESGGVVIIANDASNEVIGYTDRGTLDDAKSNPLFCAMLDNIEHAVVAAKQNRVKANAAALARAKRVRQALGSVTLKSKVDPLLTDLWHQYYEPYTLLTPIIDSVHCVPGCVATAMAQVMRYWQWPKHGYGAYSYTDSLGCEQTLSCDFSSHTYNWKNMIDNYDGVEYTEAQGLAVAQLMADCGIAVDMKYNVGASGAASIKQPRALYKHFGYDHSMQMHFRDFYTIDEWTYMLKRELSAGHPVLISGHHMRLGHAFVCDGYDENDYFHFSFGNPDGKGNGFFYLPYLTPDYLPSQDYTSPENGFNLLQSIVTNVVPTWHEDASGVENHVYAFSYIEALANDTVVVNRLGNVGWNIHSDSVALALQKDGEVVSLPCVYSHDFLLEELDDTVYTDTFAIQLDGLEPGTYKLVPMYRDNGCWLEARTSVGEPNYLIADVKETSVEIKSDTASTAYLTLENCEFPDWLSTTVTPNYKITIQNHGSEFCGRMYVILENVIDSLPIVVLQEQGLTLAADELTTRHFQLTRTTIPAGEYILRICYENDLFSSGLYLFDELPEKRVIVSKVRPDAIADVVKDEGSSKFYSVSGVRLNEKPTQRGVYIKSGKKKAAL